MVHRILIFILFGVLCANSQVCHNNCTNPLSSIINAKLMSNKKGEISFDRYYRYCEIQDYLTKLQFAYKDLVQLENFGLSYENRNLTLIKISSGGNCRKPVIILDAGIHAREWLAPALALYVIHQLIEISQNKKLIENIDWVIIPLINPDGYEYTHTDNRLWRKNRSKGKVCYGVDLNRNFDYHWTNTSGKECAIVYSGPKPFSEPEALALSQIIAKYANRTKLYLSAHTAAQSILHPWGYTTDLPVNRIELYDLAQNVTQAIYNINRTEYRVGSSANVLGLGSGTSRDWAYATAKINLSYTLELEAYGNVSYKHRHEMPPERILRVVSEVFEGIKVFHDYIKQKYC